MDLQASQKTVSELLSSNTFVIPAYQRPYAWNEDQCSVLWDDLIQFYKESKGEEHKYFLGPIVCYEDEEKKLQVIDGQQRITTLLLLLKAVYRKLNKMTKDNSAEKEKIEGLQRQVGQCMWQVDSMTEKPKFAEVRIETHVYTDNEYNEHLQKVLSDSDLRNDDKFDGTYQYLKNYNFFINKIDNPSFDELGFQGNLEEFIVCLKDSCVLLPIICKDFNMGLKIFQTLNDRGMPLSDTDIFKHKLYTNYEDEKKEEFINNWSKITDICEDDGHIKIRDIFGYYMHVITAKEGRTKIKGRKRLSLKDMRDFYLKDNSDYLSEKKEALVTDIENQAILWSAIRNEFTNDNYEKLFEAVDENTKKYLQILSLYPKGGSGQNMVAVLFHKYYKDNRYDGKELNPLLRKIVAALYFLYIQNRYADYIERRAFIMNNNIYHDRDVLDGDGVFKPEEITHEAITAVIKERIDGKAGKGLLALYAYLDAHQEHVLNVGGYHIEHIFPRKWQDANYNGWTKEAAGQYIESIGNKVLCEYNINIQAGNEYFNNKKKRYKNSKIHELQSLAENQDKQDWLQEDIQARKEKMANTFITFFYDEFSKPTK